ncbi:MAG: hypothetical protein GXP45_02450 [bacterium]|nr:hypothetical protein [bacterium]
MSANQTHKYRDQISTMIQEASVAEYLYEEVESLIQHLHYYKLKNIVDNINLLLEYLQFLDKQNTEQLQKLIEMFPEEGEVEEIHIDYFASQNTRDEL